MSGDRITLEHGAGGRVMRQLIAEVFAAGAPAATNGDVGLAQLDDGAALHVGERWLVLTTDSHVIHPIFFPGGDIGRLAVCGTVNDLAMMGATKPLALTCSVVLEEGFQLADLERVQQSMAAACHEAGTTIVTGDTKVMGRGEIDGIIINTAGIGWADRVVHDDGLRPGDHIIVTGACGEHGLAVLAARNSLGLEGALRSDVAPLGALVAAVLAAGGQDVIAMKDPTRGGVAGALHEMAAKSAVGVVIEERAFPVSDAVHSASELLGIDPLFVANEGKAVIGVRGAGAAARVLQALHAHPLGRDAASIGTAVDEHIGKVVLDTGFGRRLLPEPSGEPLPRIC